MPWPSRTAGRVRPALAGAVVGVLAGTLLLGVLGAGTAQAATDPVAPAVAPAVVEGLAPYLPQRSCDPTVKPGLAALRSLLLATYGGRDLGVTRDCAVGGSSEHKEGRAWDWGLLATAPAEKAAAEQFLSWLLAPGPDGVAAYNGRRLGVMYVIWNRQIWSSYRAAEGWRPYSGSEPHTEHIHLSLAWTGAMARTSWWTGVAAPVDYGPCVQVAGAPAPPYSGPRATPCPAPLNPASLTGTPLLSQGATGAYVLALQQLLSVTPATGYFGPITNGALLSFQQARGLAPTGTTTPETWAALRGPAPPSPTPVPSGTPIVTAPRALPAVLRYLVRPGDTLTRVAARWWSSVPAIRAASRLSTDRLRVGQVLTVPVRSGLTKYSRTTLRRGDHSVAVRALQTAMRLPPRYRTAHFGPVTTRRVNAVKRDHGWRTDGVAGPGVWRALGA